MGKNYQRIRAALFISGLDRNDGREKERLYNEGRIEESIMDLFRKRNGEKAVFFLHIPKCAGTTLTEEILKKRFAPKEMIIFYEHGTNVLIDKLKKMSKRKQEKIKCIAGHYAYGIDRYYSGRPFSYITVLRNPVDRIISHYYYARRETKHYLYEEIKKKRLTLKQYIENKLSLELNNGQTRILAGIGWGCGFGDCTREMLEQAKKNLDLFEIVGITEEFESFLLLLRKKWGWHIPEFVNKNVSKDRLETEEIDEETLLLIKKYNRLDIELYEYATSIFRKLYSEHNSQV